MAAQQPARTSPELRARLHSARANVGITPRPGALPKALMRLHWDVAHYMRMNVPALENDQDAEKIERQRQERERLRKRGPSLTP